MRLPVNTLAIAVLLVYLVGVHLWFVAPQLGISAQMNDLREQELRFLFSEGEIALRGGIRRCQPGHACVIIAEHLALDDLGNFSSGEGHRESS